MYTSEGFGGGTTVSKLHKVVVVDPLKSAKTVFYTCRRSKRIFVYSTEPLVFSLSSRHGPPPRRVNTAGTGPY